MRFLRFANLVIVIAALAAAPLQPARAGKWTWQELYKWGNYIDASEELKACLDKGQNTAAINYYYADCLYRLKKVEASIPYYEKAYKLDPGGPYGRYAYRVLRRRRKLAAKNVTHGVSSPGSPWSGHPGRHDRPMAPSTSSSASAVDSKEEEESARYSDIARKLPKIPEVVKPSPTLQDITSWSVLNRGYYYTLAAERVDYAEQRLAAGRKLLEQVNRRLTGSGSSFRQYGETLADTKARLAADQKLRDKVLKPYKDNVTALTKQLRDEKAILYLCQEARSLSYPSRYPYRGF